MLDQKLHSRLEGVSHTGGVLLLLVYSKSIGASVDRSVRLPIMTSRYTPFVRVCSVDAVRMLSKSRSGGP